MEKNVGIILRSLSPQKQKIIIFDRELGKLQAVPDQQRCDNITHLRPGVKIIYHYRTSGQLVFLSSLEIIDMPYSLAQHDLLFVHHCLEICYYFIPQGIYMPEIYDMLTLLYMPNSWFTTSNRMLLFLCKLFIVIGVVPEESLLRPDLLIRLHRMTLDRIVQEHIDLSGTTNMLIWLRACIAMHSYSAQFTTINFLYDEQYFFGSHHKVING